MPTQLFAKEDVVLLHISDLHFGLHDKEKVDAVTLVAQEYKPHLVCVTGDVVDRPSKRNFESGGFGGRKNRVEDGSIISAQDKQERGGGLL